MHYALVKGNRGQRKTAKDAMLILTRRSRVAVMIRTRVRLKVLRMNGNVVHLGFESDPVIPMDRLEKRTKNAVEHHNVDSPKD